ncbi:unnamed protein product [Ostreobium quekettii]|uniref:Protein kinase domain-containing protein n=1 Tax=Ostreobium quekettii TaxID=121088 RepID=A0A8S1J4A1_9CHLO|nr:unnamed protein product [Ostreobium quekettii]|eukprot:evm.model.scf_1044.1 EVM.evm.TU.scf_1044.1   scf_1044:11223-15496(+)
MRPRRRPLALRLLAWLRGGGGSEPEKRAQGQGEGGENDAACANGCADRPSDPGGPLALHGRRSAGQGAAPGRGGDAAIGVESTLRDIPLDQLDVEARMMLSPKRMRAPLRRVYKWGELLGTGGFAAVRLVTHKRTGERCACKVMKLPARDAPPHELSRAEVFREIEILSNTNHPNVLALREFHVGREMVYIVTELLQGGMLLDALLEREEHRYTEDDARIVFSQLLEGVGYLHDRDVAHRDLKLENLLLVEKGNIKHIKIVDFGLAKRTMNAMTTAAGTPQFVAPEVLRREVQAYDKSVDMWSAGVILYILLAGFPPFYDPNEAVMYSKIRSGQYSFADPVWQNVTKAGKDLVSKLLQVNPTQRLDVRGAKEHEWMTGELPREDSAPLAAAHAKLAHPKLLKAAGMVVMAINGMRREQLGEQLELSLGSSQEQSEELSLAGMVGEKSSHGEHHALDSQELAEEDGGSLLSPSSPAGMKDRDRLLSVDAPMGAAPDHIDPPHEGSPGPGHHGRQVPDGMVLNSVSNAGQPAATGAAPEYLNLTAVLSLGDEHHTRRASDGNLLTTVSDGAEALSSYGNASPVSYPGRGGLAGSPPPGRESPVSYPGRGLLPTYLQPFEEEADPPSGSEPANGIVSRKMHDRPSYPTFKLVKTEGGQQGKRARVGRQGKGNRSLSLPAPRHKQR